MASTDVSQWPCVRCRLDLEFLGRQVDSGTVARLEAVAETPFKRLSYTAAVHILEEHVRAKKKKFEFPVRLTRAPRILLPAVWAVLVLLCGRWALITHDASAGKCRGHAAREPAGDSKCARMQPRPMGHLSARR